MMKKTAMLEFTSRNLPTDERNSTYWWACGNRMFKTV